MANESGLRALGARIDSERGRPKARRSGKPKWSTTEKVVVSLCAVSCCWWRSPAAATPTCAYRYDQINKVHISAEVAAANGGPSPSSSSARTLGSASRRRRAGLRLGVGGHRPAQRRRAAVAGDAFDQADTGHVHPAGHRRLHAAAGHLTVRHLQPDQLFVQHRARPVGQDDHGELRHPDQPRCAGRLLRFPERRERVGRRLPRLPLPGQGRLLGPRHHDARLPAAQRRPGPGRGPGPPLRVLRRTATGSTTGRATSAGSSARTCSSRH